MFDGPRLLVSIPAKELAPNTPTGSTFSFTELRTFTISPDLTAGLDLLQEACGPEASAITVIARPEMFTHGAALQWLFERVAGTTHHLCFSDGETIRFVRERQNHVFLYRGGVARCRGALRNLERRAPELFSQIRSQVNTAHVFGTRVRTTILGRIGATEASHLVLPFFTSRRGIDHDLQLLLAQDAVDLDSVGNPESTSFVICTEATLGIPAFMAALVAALTDAYLHPERCLIIQLPLPDLTAPMLEQRLELLLNALHHYAPTLPSGRPSNVVLHLRGDGALPMHVLGGRSSLVAHASYAFWQRSPEFYASFSDLLVLNDESSRLGRTAFRSMLAQLTGRTWTERTLPHPDRIPHEHFRW